MHQKRLAAGLGPDPLWEFTVLPQTHHLDLNGREGQGKGKERERRGGRGEEGVTREGQAGREGREGDKGERTGSLREREGENSRPTVISRSRRLCAQMCDRDDFCA